MTKTKRAKIEAESLARYIASNWHLMLGGNLGIAAQVREVEDRGGHWIRTGRCP